MRRVLIQRLASLRHGVCGLAVAVLLGVAGPALSDSHDRTAISLDDAIAIVRDKSGGKVLRAETTHKGDRVVHEIRVLTDDGHVRTYRVDGRTGKVT